MGEFDGKVAVITGAGSGMATGLGARVRPRRRQGARGRRQRPRERHGRGARRCGRAVPLRRHPGVRRRGDVRRRAPTRSVASTPCSTSPASAARSRSPRSRMDEYDRIMAVDLKGVLLGTKHGDQGDAPDGWWVDRELVVDRRHQRVDHADERLLGGEGRRDLVHQVGRDRVRRPGHPRQCDLPGLHRDRALRRPGGRRPVPGAGGERRAASAPANPRRWPSSPRSSPPTGRASSPAPSSPSTAA